jgi:hypothetical protein
MGGKIACDRNEDMSASVGIAPGSELTNACLQHLIGMEVCIFAQNGAGEGGDQWRWGMAELEAPCNKSCHEINLSLPVESIE